MQGIFGVFQALLFVSALSLVVAAILGWRVYSLKKTLASYREAVREQQDAIELYGQIRELQDKRNADTERRAAEYFAKIEEVIKEREVWREWYNDQSIGHDNAQQLMMRTIDRLGAQITRLTGQPPRIEPVLHFVSEGFQAAHGEQARRERNDAQEAQRLLDEAAKRLAAGGP